ncbi:MULTISPECIES: single-stranded DNA-binding protein [unclassified Clostridioides]|uniref:single-stranded DNA-binding protein n=1 Tax=unclassified Clostridioides TaxID=2635829 RepID=UPI001D0F601A|nr:single-stranded DNA-binding protein [Clostridioides sp. ES-S-0171-01]MCC0689700.1 single-stranded DNA-binding protein [Clostridioides sp. ES-S-0056-01]MCC0716802.1 single-stranded DNA-binding protein [Clostridioides sp. ES-S-0077-01]
MNNVCLVGRLTKEPELRYIPGTGTPVATFTIAIDRDYVNKDGQKETDFIPVEVMGKSAEYCASYITKGRLVSLKGEIRVDSYTDKKTGEKRTFTKVHTKMVTSLESSKKQTSNKELSYKAIYDDPDIPF